MCKRSYENVFKIFGSKILFATLPLLPPPIVHMLLIKVLPSTTLLQLPPFLVFTLSKLVFFAISEIIEMRWEVNLP